MVSESHQDVEVQVRPDSGRAVIEGKTVVPFQSFVTLVIQRKVQQICKQWGKEPVIVNSDLLTHLASAPQDTVENRGHIITVSLGVGMILGIWLSAAAFLALVMAGMVPGIRELSVVIGGILGLCILTLILMKMQRVKRGEKLVETIESLSSFLGK